MQSDIKAVERIHKQLINFAGPLKNRTVLDYGCGRGDAVRLLLDQKPKNIFAVDSDAKKIAVINELFSLEISRGLLKTGIIFDPSQLRCSFDVIFCHNVLELIENKEEFVQTLYDLLSEHGALILSHVDFDSIIYNSSLKELTRKLVFNFSDAKQDWMAFIDGQIGRKIPGIIRRAGIQNFLFETWRLTEASYQNDSYGYLMAKMIIGAADGFNKDDLIAWEMDHKNKVTLQDYFFAVDVDIAKLFKL